MRKRKKEYHYLWHEQEYTIPGSGLVYIHQYKHRHNCPQLHVSCKQSKENLSDPKTYPRVLDYSNY